MKMYLNFFEKKLNTKSCLGALIFISSSCFNLKINAFQPPDQKFYEAIQNYLKKNVISDEPGKQTKAAPTMNPEDKPIEGQAPPAITMKYPMQSRHVKGKMTMPSVRVTKSQSQDEKFLNFLLLNENGRGEFSPVFSNTPKPIFNALLEGIHQKIFMITHSGLLAMFMYYHNEIMLGSTYSQPLKDFMNTLYADLHKNWDVKINKTGDWTVFNPKNSSCKNELTDLGFDESQLLNAWDQEKSLVDNLKNKIFIETSVNNFEGLFRSNNVLRKRIFLYSHGRSPFMKYPLVAGFTREEYLQFLTFINSTTDFLFVLSCYAGGANSIDFYDQDKQEEKKVLDSLKINFPIALVSTAETITRCWRPVVGNQISISNMINFQIFFQLLNHYLANPSAIKLKSAIAEITKQMPYRQQTGTPLVRYPGTSKFFRALQLDRDVKMLTMTAMKAYALDLRHKKDNVLLPFALEKDQTLLLYPAIVTTPLKITSDRNYIISMIPGNALHFINTLSITKTDGDRRAWFKILLDSIEFKDEESFASKLYYIAQLYVGKEEYKNVIVRVTPLLSEILSPELHGRQLMYTTNRRRGPIHEMSIGRTQRKNMAKRQFEEAGLPTKAALDQATGGMQTLPMVQEAIKESLAAISGE